MIPELEPYCGSWIVVFREDQKPVLETFQRSVAEAVNQRAYEVLTAAQWLARFNSSLKSEPINDKTHRETKMRKPNPKPKPSYPSPYDPIRKRSNNKPNIDERAHVNQLVVIVIGESRAFAGEVTETDPETGEVLAVYVTGGRMVRHVSGSPLTIRLLPRDWTDKQTVFSACPRKGWDSSVHAHDALRSLYDKWCLERVGVKSLRKAAESKDIGLTDEQRRAWLAKYSRPAK